MIHMKMLYLAVFCLILSFIPVFWNPVTQPWIGIEIAIEVVVWLIIIVEIAYNIWRRRR